MVQVNANLVKAVFWALLWVESFDVVARESTIRASLGVGVAQICRTVFVHVADLVYFDRTLFATPVALLPASIKTAVNAHLGVGFDVVAARTLSVGVGQWLSRWQSSIKRDRIWLVADNVFVVFPAFANLRNHDNLLLCVFRICCKNGPLIKITKQRKEILVKIVAN